MVPFAFSAHLNKPSSLFFVFFEISFVQADGVVLEAKCLRLRRRFSLEVTPPGSDLFVSSLVGDGVIYSVLF